MDTLNICFIFCVYNSSKSLLTEFPEFLHCRVFRGKPFLQPACGNTLINSLPLSRLFQHGSEMPFSFDFVRPESQCTCQLLSGTFHRFGDAVTALQASANLLYGKESELIVATEEPCNASLILRRCKGTGRIDQPASRTKHTHGTIQNLVLAICAKSHILRTPLLTGCLVFPKHSLSGTGRIYQDFIKIGRKELCQTSRSLIGDTGIPKSHALHVFRQNLCSGRMYLIAEQKTLPLHFCGNLATFSSRCCTQIQNPFSGLHLQKLHRRHGTGLLDIIHPRLVQWMLSRLITGFIIISVLSPGNRR